MVCSDYYPTSTLPGSVWADCKNCKYGSYLGCTVKKTDMKENRTPFALSEWLKDTNRKVVTSYGEPVKIVFTKGYGDYPILAVIYDGDTTDSAWYTTEGKGVGIGVRNHDQLYFVGEPELTEFELHLLDWMSSDCNGKIPMNDMKRAVRLRAKELLDLAREELEREGGVDFTPIESTLEYKAGYHKGKEEAMKGMPKWRVGGLSELSEIGYGIGCYDLFTKTHHLSLSELEALPKEDVATITVDNI